MAMLANARSSSPFMVTAPWGNLLQLTTTIFDIKDLGSVGAVQGMSAGANSMFLATSGPFSVAVFDIAARTMTPVGKPIRLPAQQPVGVKDGGLAFANDKGGIWFIRPDATYVRLVDSATSQDLFRFTVDRQSGENLVWLEGERPNGDFENINLWTAPYTTDPQKVARKKVAHLGTLKSEGGVLVANAGMVLLRETSKTMRLVRMSDGWGWSIPAEPNERMIDALWVDDNEVIVGTGPDGAFSGDFINGVMRLQRSALGNPTIPPY